jgi:nucleotide-binding universal stress UspA family protein
MGLPELPYEASLGAVEADYLEAAAARVQAAGVPSVSTKLIRVDNTAGALEEHRVAVGAGLTVMASHGRGAVERAWLGSVADRFVRTTEAPVLLVRARPAEETQDLSVDVSFEKVLVPIDGSEFSKAALAPATALAGATGTQYVLVRIIEPPYTPGAALLPAGFEFSEKQVEALRREAEADLEAVAKPLRAQGNAVATVSEFSAPIATGILRLAEKRRVDVIAIATHGRGGITRTVLGSVADKVIRGADCPVLIVRPRD